MGTKLIYAGIDEAGYGPLLGPLCVGSAVLVIDSFRPRSRKAASRPDLWAMLAPAVVREIKDTGETSIAVNDSKRVKISNGAKRHPLEHLERAILSIAACMGRDCFCDSELHRVCDAVNADLSSIDWYAGDDLPLPMASTPDQIRLASARLRAASTRAKVSFAALACRVCDERDFNRDVERGALKSDISFDLVGALLLAIWHAYAGDESLDEFGPRVVVDRQGGRISYEQHLCRALPDARVTIVLEHPDASVYDLSAGDGRRMRVTFQIKADAEHFPTALASMTAKYTRELAMMRFNRYWCGRIAELKPTAGYGADAKRWLRDVEHATSAEERRALRRMA